LAVASDDGSEVLAVVVYHGYRPSLRSIEISCAASNKRWLTRGVLRALMAYPFSQLDCARVTCTTGRSNRATINFLLKLGFAREGILRRGFVREDAVIYGLLAPHWRASRWMEGATAHGQKDARAAASA
jgi:RimJ/RimL family protein N-acetyltransferase